MNATIYIKIPSGQSMEFYPQTFPLSSRHDLDTVLDVLTEIRDSICYNANQHDNHNLHKGDVITITIV